eukprot:CAMPEP_0170521924 /NCGR_PEP_ID=MMETSP0209-20121228/7342_1 /TAXON_ID=665100 ORGANISM="Litonotus pictus, Strain P1" /NCGR_SAMPLE_ID=MMETSP0209 /ASSEMBLY_ACC=CAM_ASM_000301 /LENGTH=560 /DNA_ID=CAMNT_0010809127 /DNA_START=34 /DNA_END=1716 /DNA_ORIENTATION=+
MLPLGDYEENTVFSPFTLSEHYFKIIEPAGVRFEDLLQKKLNPETKLFDDIDEEEVIEEDEHVYEWETEYRNSKKFSTGFKKKEKEANYYSMLGLENEFINATQDEIRRAFKKNSILYHPDKIEINSEEEKEEVNKKWLKFKDAYETLSDPDKKYRYDSTFEFDDTIPSITEARVIKKDKDFFSVFGPTFLKNSIWSNRKPVPKIGDMDTELNKVKRFYNFWYAFSSWRDFEAEGEHNLDEAENRWEKRQMLKENKKLKATKLKDEKARIRSLVDLAYAHDPRIIAEEMKKEEERERIRKERAELALKVAREREENDRRIKLEYEERKKREAEELALLKKTLYEKLLDTVKNTLNINLTSNDLFTIQLNHSVDTTKTILSEIEMQTSTEDKIRKFKELGNKKLGLKFVDDKKESSIWSKEEIFNLQKAVKKFPAGTVNRWEKILEIVKTKGTNQIISMSHYLATNPGMKIVGDTVDLKELLGGNKEKKAEKVDIEEKQEEKKEDWSENQQKALESALKKYPGSLPANERWTKIASEVPDKNKKQCVERFKFLSQKLKENK